MSDLSESRFAVRAELLRVYHQVDSTRSTCLWLGVLASILAVIALVGLFKNPSVELGVRIAVLGVTAAMFLLSWRKLFSDLRLYSTVPAVLVTALLVWKPIVTLVTTRQWTISIEDPLGLNAICIVILLAVDLWVRVPSQETMEYLREHRDEWHALVASDGSRAVLSARQKRLESRQRPA